MAQQHTSPAEEASAAGGTLPVGSAAPRRRILGVSTKIYFSAARTRSYVASLVELLSQDLGLLDKVDVFVIPDLVTVTSVIEQLRAATTTAAVAEGGVSAATAAVAGILPGAQDCYSEDAGAFTGEVSPAVLAEVGVRIVELGHAERRQLFGETDASTASKAAAVVRNGMVPLVCVGDVHAPPPSSAAGEGDYEGVRAAVDQVLVQVASVIAAVPDEAEVILAYEPVWAIGQAEPAGVEHVRGVSEGIRDSWPVRLRKGPTRILYGGSAGPGLFAKLSGAVDGLFLGRFGHSPEAFLQTAREVADA